MNRMLMSLLPLVAVACAGAQTPGPANKVTETSRVARFVPGPGNRPQGALLRNGTFVTFSLGLAQRLPASLSKNASMQVVGEEFSYEGSKAIQARSVTIAGVSYNDDGPMIGEPNLLGRPGAGPNALPPPPAGVTPAGAAGAEGVPPPRPDRPAPPPPAPANNPLSSPEAPPATTPPAGPAGL